MTWRIELSETAKKQLFKLDKQTQSKIFRYLRKRVSTDKDPRRFGGPLRRDLFGLWKYRVGDYRVVCDIQDKKVLVLVICLGHRRKVYGGH